VPEAQVSSLPNPLADLGAMAPAVSPGTAIHDHFAAALDRGGRGAEIEARARRDRVRPGGHPGGAVSLAGKPRRGSRPRGGADARAGASGGGARAPHRPPEPRGRRPTGRCRPGCRPAMPRARADVASLGPSEARSYAALPVGSAVLLTFLAERLVAAPAGRFGRARRPGGRDTVRHRTCG
jgi:hypothetical protein